MRKRKQSEQLKPSETLKKRKQLQKHTHLPPSPLPELLNDVIVDILSRLPLDALFRFRCVCRPWYGLVGDLLFIKMQANRAIEDPKILITYSNKIFFLEFESRDRTSVVNLHPPCKVPILFLASCNGLICYTVEWERDIYLRNPFTGDNKRLPDVPSLAGTFWDYFFIGHSPAIGEYKIVMISYLHDEEVWVLTLGTQSWRRVECSQPPFNPYFDGVCLNGALHWIGSPTEGETSNAIIVFDLGHEKFGEMLLPDFRNTDIHCRMLMPVESICLWSVIVSVGGFCEIWVMNEYGNEKSWIKKFSQTQTNMVGKLQILGSLKTGEIFLERKDQFVLYHPVDKRIRMLPVSVSRSLYYGGKVHNYVETLVWPVFDV